jgi:hypothetical protein
MATAYQSLSDTERALGEKLQTQARAADEWEGYRHLHAGRIAAIADALARAFQLAQQDRAALRLAAYAHDLGLMVMQRDYTGRAGPLSLEERLDLARHPIISEQEAMRLGTPRAVQLLVRWHHEAWDGSGYPDSLQREQIPLAARILRVADAYAALTDERPFRPALSESDALQVIAEAAGLDFDPAVAQALFALEDFPELRSFAKAPQKVAPAAFEAMPEPLPAREALFVDPQPESAAEPVAEEHVTALAAEPASLLHDEATHAEEPAATEDHAPQAAALHPTSQVDFTGAMEERATTFDLWAATHLPQAAEAPADSPLEAVSVPPEEAHAEDSER